MKVNYHTHTYLCNHAVGEPADYILSAINAGFSIIGISDHGPLVKGMLSQEDMTSLWLNRHMNYQQFKDIYLPAVLQCQKDYADKIKIYRGLEIEYIKGHDDYYRQLKSQLEYLCLGAHTYEFEGKYLNPYEPTTTNLTVEGYVSTIEQALETGLFDILVHPDLFMFSYVSKNGILHEWDDKCSEVAHRIIQSAIKNDVIIEVNCGCVYLGKNKYNEYNYPRSEFWEIAKLYPKVKIIIGRDAHNPNAFNDEITKSIEEFVKQHQIPVIVDYDIGAKICTK